MSGCGSGDGVPVTFCWARGGHKVDLVASWNEWKPVEMSGDGGVFTMHVDLKEGEYMYHYLVDGKRTLDSKQPSKTVEGHGKINVVVVKQQAPQGKK